MHQFPYHGDLVVESASRTCRPPREPESHTGGLLKRDGSSSCRGRPRRGRDVADAHPVDAQGYAIRHATNHPGDGAPVLLARRAGASRPAAAPTEREPAAV
jgi:hypothetical protein